LLESELVKEGRISKDEEKKILLDNIDFLKKEIQMLETRLNKISEDVE
jgi:polyhydroxyalkanoate synthesis regulator phasin